MLGRSRGVEREDGAAAARGVRAEDRAGRAHLDVEALARDGARVGVEDDGDLVARRVLELLHHQLTPPRGRRPMHLAERLAPLVLPHRVQVEAGGPPQHEPPAVLGVRAALGEQPVERDQPRVDDERAAGGELHLRACEPERVLDRRARLLDRVTAAGHSLEHVRATVEAAVAPELRMAQAESREPFGDHDRRRGHARLRTRLERHPDVVALEHGTGARPPAELDRPRREPHPGSGPERGEHKARRSRVERLRAEEPGDDVRERPQHQGQPPPAVTVHHQTGTGVCSIASPTISSAVRPAERASGARISRCASTGLAIAFTSSGST